MSNKPTPTETVEAVLQVPEGIMTATIGRSVLMQPTMALMFNNYNELMQLWSDVNDLSGKTIEWRKVPTNPTEAQKTYGIKLP